MFAPAPFANIWLYPDTADMRCSFHGLIGLVKKMNYQPLSGDYFVFINRRRTQLKILYFEPDGYAIWQKRLEQGQWAQAPQIDANTSAISATQLQLMLSGLKVKKLYQHKRYQGKKLS
ncbi:IS66 family insertion sequence element accessory protein TnpB [Thiosulfativibrio zosterae]|uniref:Isocitrate lyase n=1 Tax=Thiosulfativibrio zosterae TaxID=2675053 RepID=A0A6F8PLW9_9GAMM|nr:IS66 family insertion sequence element accessory protein TnpB [Thiosulfativibrio zosterae]BBP43103.1 isocitrate lyase [Thiosulfativibrio zosterae]